MKHCVQNALFSVWLVVKVQQVLAHSKSLIV